MSHDHSLNFCCNKESSTWKHVHEKLKDDENYLVCWKKEDGYSAPHRAYYIEEYGHFFSLENNNSHPIVADIYMKIPKVNIK